jgi:non-ribosomal peptide synthetase component F
MTLLAVVFEYEILSYGELNRRANQLAHYLRGLGGGPDARVGICLERSLEMVVNPGADRCEHTAQSSLIFQRVFAP